MIRTGPALTALLAAIALQALPVTAQQPAEPERPVVMICALEEEGVTGWVPAVVVVTRQANGRIEVFDPILQAYVGRPIKAVVTADDRRKRSYGWALGNVKNAAGQRAERVDFRLTLNKADSTATITVQAKDYDNLITGKGVCGSPSQ